VDGKLEDGPFQLIWGKGARDMSLPKIGQTLGLVAVLLFPAIAWGSHPLITDDTGTQGQGKYQLEVNGQYDHDAEGSAETTGGQLATFLTYGASETVDVVAGVPYLWNREKENGDEVADEHGLSDTCLDVKWRFFDQDGFSLALKPGAILPTGDEDKGLGSGKVGYHLYAIATKAADPWAIHANLGYIRNENDGDDRVNLWHASLAGTYALTKELQAVGNIGVDRNADPESDNDPAFLLGGLIYSLSENFQIDCGYKHALTSTGTDWSLLAGTTYHF
jgi:hypothetical protein